MKAPRHLGLPGKAFGNKSKERVSCHNMKFTKTHYHLDLSHGKAMVTSYVARERE